MASCNYNCADLPDHLQVDCAEWPLGGVSAGAVLDCDHTISDFSNASQWTTNINSGKAKIIKGIKGEIPAASPVQVDNPIGCGAAQQLIGFDNPANWKDSNVSEDNDDFYASLNQQKQIVVLFMCEQEQIRVSNGAATMTAIPTTVPEGNRVLQMYTVQTTFFSKLGEIPYEVFDAPSGIFA